MSTATLLSILALALAVPPVYAIMTGLRQLEQLADQSRTGATPTLTVLVPALNEAETIEPALRSLLESDYPALKVIAINDRSTDATGDILDRLATTDERLSVIHVKELPSGWLGKSHALHLGAQQADSEYLLFTDADIRFAPAALRQALAYAVKHRLDHLTVLPELQASTPLLQILVLQFLIGFLLFFRPWHTRTKPHHHVGVGAFNLVRKSKHDAIGGHRAVAMTPLDDTLLGKQLKRAGATADTLLGNHAVMVDWYPSTIAMIRGLGKNGFAAFDYKLEKLLLATLLILLVSLWPIIGLLFGNHLAKLASTTTLAMGAAMLHRLIRDTDWPRWILLLAPLGTLLSLFMFWRSALLALMRGTIEWRGTEYSLAELKQRHF